MQKSIVKDNQPLVLWIGKRIKNPETFIKLANALKETNAVFGLIGITEEQLRKISERLNIRCDVCKCFGILSYGQTQVLLSRAHVLIWTSFPGFDCFPNVLLEAWVNETPVISTWDPVDVIKRNKIGFHAISFEQLKNYTKFLLENTKERKEMGRRARAYVIREHDIGKIALGYEQLFFDIVRTRRYKNSLRKRYNIN